MITLRFFRRLPHPLIALLFWNVCCFGSSGAATAAETNVIGLLTEAKAVYQRGQTQACFVLVNQAVTANPKSPDARFFRGQLYLQSRQFEKAIEDFNEVIKTVPGFGNAWEQRGEAQFRAGKIAGSIEDFDQFLKREPRQQAYLWQLGISYYYAGRYEEGRKQFELHQTVNQHDVENAVWHFLCAAKLEGVEKARQGLIPIAGDSRIPMMQIYALFAGQGTVQQIMEAAKLGEPGKAELHERLFHTYLYLSLYYDALGDQTAARENIAKATGEFAADHYMGDVARVQAQFLRAKPAPRPPK